MKKIYIKTNQLRSVKLKVFKYYDKTVKYEFKNSII